MANNNIRLGRRGILLAAAAFMLPISVQGAVFRCTLRGRVTYQDAPCATGARNAVVNIAQEAGSGRREADTAPSGPEATIPATPAGSTPSGPARPGAAGRAASLRAALSRIRLGMTRGELDALDPRLRNVRSRAIEANGHHHEWRYLADDCVVHLADEVVVGIYR